MTSVALDRRDPDGDGLTGAVQPGQATAVPPIRLHPVPGRLRDERGCHHVTGNPHGGEQPVQIVARGAGLVAGPEVLRLAEARDQPANRVLVVEDLVDLRGPSIRLENRDRDRVLVDVHPEVGHCVARDTGLAGSFHMLAPSAIRWMLHVDAERCRPFHAD